MSWEALAWIWEQDISPAAAKLVAVCIADGADENGCRYPSYSYLAKRCNLSVDTVRAHIRTLVETGVLEKTARTRENGSQSSNLYRVVAYPPLGAAPHPRITP